MSEQEKKSKSEVSDTFPAPADRTVAAEPMTPPGALALGEPENGEKAAKSEVSTTFPPDSEAKVQAEVLEPPS